MKKSHKIIASLAVTAVAVATAINVAQTKNTPVTSGCDASLWQHVYAGDPRKFSKPEDRLQVIEPCKTVTGVLMTAKTEADGDWHLRLQVDDKTLLNDKNISGQQGDLVLEPVCSNPITQTDTLAEHSCDNFQQSIFNKNMIGKTVEVTGAYVTDMEHGWREIHPVTSITVK